LLRGACVDGPLSEPGEAGQRASSTLKTVLEAHRVLSEANQGIRHTHRRPPPFVGSATVSIAPPWRMLAEDIKPHLAPESGPGPSATVVSGTWFFGYGNQFDEQKLKD